MGTVVVTLPRPKTEITCLPGPVSERAERHSVTGTDCPSWPSIA
jgi:hypothetical protein